MLFVYRFCTTYHNARYKICCRLSTLSRSSSVRGLKGLFRTGFLRKVRNCTRDQWKNPGLFRGQTTSRESDRIRMTSRRPVRFENLPTRRDPTREISNIPWPDLTRPGTFWKPDTTGGPSHDTWKALESVYPFCLCFKLFFVRCLAYDDRCIIDDLDDLDRDLPELIKRLFPTGFRKWGPLLDIVWKIPFCLWF